MSHADKLLHSFLGSVVAPLASLVTAPVLARGLDVAGRGELSAATAPLLLAAAVAGLGIPEALTYFVAHDGRRAARTRQAVWLLVALGVLAGAALLALSPVLSAGNAQLARLIRLTGLFTAPSMIVLVPRALAAGAQRWRLIAVERAAFGVLRLLAVVLLAASGHLTVLTATITLLASPLVSALCYLPVLRRDPVDRTACPGIGDLGGYGFRIWLGSLSGIALTRVSAVLMVPMAGEREAGLLAVAVTIGELPLVVSGAARDVIFSAEASSSSDDRLQQSARITTLLTGVLAAALAVTMPVWLGPLFGHGFVHARPAALAVLAATVIGCPGSVAGAALSARGRPGLRSLAMLWGALANLSVLVVLTPTLGALGAGLAMTAGATVAGGGTLLYLRTLGVALTPSLGVRGEDLRLLVALPARLLATARSTGAHR